MNYDLTEGHQLLNRLSVLFDYLHKCNGRTDDRYQIVNDLIDLITVDLCVNDAFTYDNANAPAAFYTKQSLKLPRIEQSTAGILQTSWQQVVDQLQITTPTSLIKTVDQLPTNALLKLSKHPKRYLKLKNIKHPENFTWLTLSDLNPVIQQIFTPELLQQLVAPPQAANDTSRNSDQIERQPQPRQGLNYHFTTTKDWVDTQRQSPQNPH